MASTNGDRRVQFDCTVVLAVLCFSFYVMTALPGAIGDYGTHDAGKYCEVKGLINKRVSSLVLSQEVAGSKSDMDK